MTKINRLNWFFQAGALIICIGVLLTLPHATMAEPKGKFHYATSGSQGMKSFDIHTGTGAWHSVPTAMVFGKLVVRDSKGKFIPDIATSWEIGPNFSYHKFILNKNARFTDGHTVTAEDVKFFFDRALTKPKYVWTGEIKRKVEKVEVVDDHTVIIHSPTSYSALMDRLAGYYGILPKHYFDKVGDETAVKKPIGSGPFKLVKFKQGVFIDIEANTDHYRKVPNVKEMRMTYVAEESTRMAMLKTGEVDMAMLGATFWELENREDIRIVWSKECYLASLAFYDQAFPEPSPLKDIRVRKAVSHAINRKAIAEKVMHNMVIAWADIYASYHAGFDPDLKYDAYDPEKAKALLKEAGYPNGFEIDLYARPDQKLETQAMAANLTAVGIRAKLNVPEGGIWSAMVREKKTRGLGNMGGPWWVGRDHPAVALASHVSAKSVWSFYVTKEVDDMLEELEKMSDEKKMAKTAKALSKRYRETYTRLPLWAVSTPFGLRKRVKYWEQSPGRVFARLFEYLELAD